MIKRACFCHYQFASENVTRRWLYIRSNEDWADEELMWLDINWILERREMKRSSCSAWHPRLFWGEAKGLVDQKG